MRFFQPGQIVLHENQLWYIAEVDGPDSLILFDKKSKRLKAAAVATVQRPERIRIPKHQSVYQAEPEALATAQTLVSELEVIAALPRSEKKQAICELAAKLQVATATIYRRLSQYRKAPVVSAQLRKQRTDKGSPAGLMRRNS